MPVNYEHIAIPDDVIPRASSPVFQHLLDTYASESNKVVAVWRCFSAADMSARPHPRARTVQEIMQHQPLSERRFFGEFMGVAEPPASTVLPARDQPSAYVEQFLRLAYPRLEFLARREEPWWLEPVTFFDVMRPRIWVFWRRVLHTCHHRTQLTVYLRIMNRSVPSTYGPTADVTWAGADPTQTVEAAERKAG